MHKLLLADQIVYCRQGDTAAKTILGSETIGIPATLGANFLVSAYQRTYL